MEPRPKGVDERMYSLVRIFEAGRDLASEVPEAARARVEALDAAAGFVTLLAIRGDDGALVTVEIFETLDDMRVAQEAVVRDARLSPSPPGSWPGKTITGEIVFQRGL
jgi:hypothetical protein